VSSPRTISRAGSMPPWVATLGEGGRLDLGDEAYVGIIADLHRLARSADYGIIEQALACVEPTGLSEQSLVTLVRGTYPFRSRLANWTSFRDAARQVLLDRSRPVGAILAGL
jgi:adenine-specific DNA-methyltransferase